MTLKEFRDVLLTVCENVYHYEAAEEDLERYIVWQEISGTSEYASNARQETVKNVQVDLYTKIEFDPLLESLLQELEENDVAFAEPETVYDKDTKCIRHIIECEVL